MPRRLPPPNAGASQAEGASLTQAPPPLWVYLVPPRCVEIWQQVVSYALSDPSTARRPLPEVYRAVDNWIDHVPLELAIGDAQSRAGALVTLMQVLRYWRGRALSYLNLPGAYSFVYEVISTATRWAGRMGEGGDLIYSASSSALWSIYPQQLYDAAGTPMQFIMEHLFLPLCTVVNRGIEAAAAAQEANFRPSSRRLVFGIVSVTEPNGRQWSYKLLPGLVNDLWDLENIINPESSISPDYEVGSGVVQLSLRAHQAAKTLKFRIVRAPLQLKQIRRRRVGVFTLINTIPDIDLSRYQVFTQEQAQTAGGVLLDHCLIHALRVAGIPEPTVKSVAGFIPGRSVTLVALDRIFKDGELNVTVTYSTPACWYHVQSIHLGSSEPEARRVELGLIEHHVFLNEPCAITTLYLQNWRRLRPDQRPYTNLARMDHGVPAEYYDTARSTSFEILNWMYHHEGFLRKPSIGELSVPYRKSLVKEDFSPDELEYDPKISARAISAEDTSKDNTDDAPASIWFGDFETLVTSGRHVPFLLCYGQRGKPITAVDCSEDLRLALEIMIGTATETGNAFFYFHNLPYDGSFILNELRPCEGSILEQGSGRIIRFRIIAVDGKWCEFRDSLALMSFPLRKFPAMLGVESEKEIMPYKAYTLATMHDYLTPDQILVLDQSYSASDLLAAAARAGAWDDQDGRISMWEYAVYYCRRDVEVLSEGYWRFEEMMYNATGQHLWARLTAASLAFHSLRLKKVFDGCYELSGAPALAIRNTVVGGRCMLARNVKQQCSEPVSDFDAVSLYPSAMAELYTVKGLPKILTDEDIRQFEQRRGRWDAFFIKIRITRVGRELDFPLISYKDKYGREFVNKPGILWVNDITLDDLIVFHEITYEVLGGYYFNEGKNYTLQTVIKELFELRLDAKREKKAIEVVYKLLMNSCYGKTIMKPRASRKEIMTESQLLREILGTPFTIVGYQELQNRNFLVKTSVDVLDNWSIPATGSHILAMSKRIITRVTSLAQDLGIPVFYTDTDSIHILRDEVGRLATAYKQLYGKELIGKNLGQFHTDFPCTARGMMWSKRFIGVGKKAYIDLLTDGVDECYHIRMKGIPERSLLKLCERRGITPLELYERFYEDPEFKCTFDLADAKPCFDRKADLTIFTLPHFYRQIGFA